MEHKDLINILLVDDHEMVREGLVVFLSTQPDFRVVGQADSGQVALTLVETTQPDIILMDLIMPGMDGIETTKRIKFAYPHIEIIALTSFIDDEKVVSAIKAGVSGYVMKDVNPMELAQAIRAAARGEVYLVPAAARFLAKKMRPEFLNNHNDQAFIENLTNREMEVLIWVAKGLTNQEIADRLKISIKTVKVHFGNVLQKLNLENRVQAVLYALSHDLVSLDEIDV